MGTGALLGIVTKINSRYWVRTWINYKLSRMLEPSGAEATNLPSNSGLCQLPVQGEAFCPPVVPLLCTLLVYQLLQWYHANTKCVKEEKEKKQIPLAATWNLPVDRHLRPGTAMTRSRSTLISGRKTLLESHRPNHVVRSAMYYYLGILHVCSSFRDSWAALCSFVFVSLGSCVWLGS